VLEGSPPEPPDRARRPGGATFTAYAVVQEMSPTEFLDHLKSTGRITHSEAERVRNELSSARRDEVIRRLMELLSRRKRPEKGSS
jgi:hypothetical protein